MDLDDLQPAPEEPRKKKEREERPERPKNSLKEDLDYRINGLEKAKDEPGMSPADLGALNRAIAKLREKKAEKEASKPIKQPEEEKF